jgi:hypothetical protein
MHTSHLLAIYKGSTPAKQALAFLRASHVRSGIYLEASSENQPLELPTRPSLKLHARYYRQWLLKGESAVLVPVRLGELANVQQALREHTSVYSLFAFPEYEERFLHTERTLPFFQLNQHKLRSAGSALASSIILGNSAPRGSARLLLRRLNTLDTQIAQVRNYLKHSGTLETSSVSVAEWGVAENVSANKTPAEWILDNWQIVRSDGAAIRTLLSSPDYALLPVIREGDYQRFPRVYAVAQDIVANANGDVSRQMLKTYLHAYQSVAPLYEDELERLPAFLKLALLEYLGRLCRNIQRSQIESDLASFWASRLVSASRISRRELDLAVARLIAVAGTPSAGSIDILLRRLQEEDIATPQLRDWLDQASGHRLSEMVQEWHSQQSAEQVAFQNISASLKFLSYVRWEEIHDESSVLEKQLSQDPAHIYDKMERSSKEHYRQQAQAISRGSSHDELYVAERALELAANGTDQVSRHVGYYLVDAGREKLEALVESRISRRERFIRRV